MEYNSVFGLDIFDLYESEDISNMIKNPMENNQQLRILSNELYKGDFINGKRTKHPTYYENVVEPIVSKEKWNNCQSQKLRNARHYERTGTYLFTNKLKCSKCGRFLGGSATTKKNGNKYYYYKCEHCKTTFKEVDIEQKLLYEIAKYDCIYVSKKVFNFLTDVIAPQGILAVVEKPNPNTRIKYDQDIILVLDGIQDPGN